MTATSIITVNAITTAVNAMVDQSLTFGAACAAVRGYRMSGKLDDKTARGYFQTALASKVPAYAKQTTDKGFPAQGSAFQRAVSRLMAATKPEAVNRKVEKAELEVPANILAAAAKLWALCSQYEGAAKLAATALANVKAGK